MDTSSLLKQALDYRADSLLQDWTSHVIAHWHSQHSLNDYEQHNLQQRMTVIVQALMPILLRTPVERFEFDPECALAEEVRLLVGEQARSGIQPAQTSYLIIALKQVLTQRLIAVAPSVAELSAALLWLEQVLDRLALFSFEAFVETRERIIVQQSLSLMELSTPVLRLWHQVLLLPLVGVLDTARARQLTERLLEAVTRHEALVTIIDVTGVPVLDTSVARHLMKTIDAARLLGTSIVMTGISPEGAQTLTKLGISFSDVTSRASLRAGIAEALYLVGRRISPIGQNGDVKP